MEDLKERLDQSLDADEDTCIDVINESVSDEPGILKVGVDTLHEQVAFEYDPALVSEPDILRIAQRMGPRVQQRFQTCTMQLQRKGGRSCESCALALEDRVRDMQGVRHATASYLGGVLSVHYDDALISPDQIVQGVKQFGVSVTKPGHDITDTIASQIKHWHGWLQADRLAPILTAATLVAMFAGLIAEQNAAPEVATLFFAIAYAAGGAFGLKGGIETLRHGRIDIDLLMIFAAVGAWIVGSPFEGAMLLFLFSFSNVLQTFAMDRTRHAIRALMQLRPSEALTRRDGGTHMVSVEKLVPGDVVIVRPGERIPIDAQVIEGESTVDQSSITGESMPVNKYVGDAVLAGTINQAGGLEVRVTRRASDSTIAKMIKLVEEAQSEKAHTQRFIDRFEQVYALGVIVATALLIFVPVSLLGEAFDPAFYRAMTVMVAASPCALVISTPATILSAIGNGARRGVLFKGGVHLEQAALIKVVTFDKTGTLTEGKPYVTDVVSLRQHVDEDQLLALAAAVESKSEHPLARAVVAAAKDRALTIVDASAFQAEAGQGVRALVGEQQVAIGGLRYFSHYAGMDLELAGCEIERLQSEGKTPVLVAQIDAEDNAHALGVIGIADVLRANVADVIRDLKAAGVERVVMLTGDNERVAQTIAAQAGVDEYYADLLPQDKVQRVKELKERYGSLAMVGDGVNDAPALATATVGVAMGAAGSDVALETADVVLLSNELDNIPYVIALSRQARKTLIVNLGFAMFMIALMLVSIFAVQLPLPLAVVGHEGGTVLVSLNGLRMLFYKRR